VGVEGEVLGEVEEAGGGSDAVVLAQAAVARQGPDREEHLLLVEDHGVAVGGERRGVGGGELAAGRALRPQPPADLAVETEDPYLSLGRHRHQHPVAVDVHPAEETVAVRRLALGALAEVHSPHDGAVAPGDPEG
jgi:hypothetical protein